MWFKLNLISFLTFCIFASTAANEHSSIKTKNLLDSFKQFFWSDANEGESLFEKIRNEKLQAKKRVEKLMNRHQNELVDEDDLDYYENEYEFVKHFLKKIDFTSDHTAKNRLIDKLIQMIKAKYEGKLNKLLLQESMLCKINDSEADEFDTLENVRPKFQIGDIIEFKRFGYSHFSIYHGNNRIVQFETPLYNNITIKNLFFNFPSLTLVNLIDKISHGDLVRVNNKLKLNLPANLTEINSRIDNAIALNQTEKYNIFLHNCEHWATYIR